MQKRILVVDDDPLILAAIRRVLRSRKVDVVTAESGEQALALMAAEPLPVVLSDYRMPGMNGAELLETIEARWPETVRMIISGQSDFDTVLNAIQTGVVHKFLAKPWANEELVNQVMTALAEYSLAESQELSAAEGAQQAVTRPPAAALRSEGAELQAILETVQDGLVTIDRQGVMLLVNPALERIFGYSAHELLGRNISMLMPEPYRSQHDGFLRAYSSPGRKGIIGSKRRMVGLRKNGEVFPLDLSANEMRIEGEIRFLGTLRDISTEVAAERDNQLLLTALESCQDGFALFSATGRLIRCNQQFLRLYAQCRPAPVPGVSYREFIRNCRQSGLFPCNDVNTEAWVERFMTAHDELPCVREYQLDNGRWVEIHETRTDAGGVIAFHLDVSARKRAALALEEAVYLAQQANLAKSRFLAMMSHEIRTPLNGVLGLLQLLGDSSLDTTQRNYVNTALQSGQGLLAVISDILDFSKADAHKVELKPEPTDLRALLSELQHLFRPGADDKGLTLTHRVDDAVPEMALVDLARLRQVLLNLLGNALKFTHQGGVELSLSVEVSLRLRFEVVDTGIGIPVGEQHKLFSEFSALRRPGDRVYEGTGLGLAISARLVELMGGALQVNSTEGMGSSFWFTLPLAVADGPVQRETSSDPVPVAGVSVLLVEDNATNRLVCEAMLRGAGVKVTSAASGVDALLCCEQQHFDLVLMDISMPGMDGIETTRQLRLCRGWQHTPVIALTAYAMEGDKARFLQQGMTDYLAKPLDKQRLLSMISHYVQPAEAEAGAAVLTEVDAESGAEADLDIELVVDSAQLKQLADDTSLEMLPQLADIFQADVSERLDALMQALQEGLEGHQEMIQRQFHTLGSSSALYGLTALSERARALERICRTGGVPERQQVEAFIRLAQQCQAALVAAINEVCKPDGY